MTKTPTPEETAEKIVSDPMAACSETEMERLIAAVIREAVEAETARCVKIAEDCAAQFEKFAEEAKNSMDRVLNAMGASDCKRVGIAIRESVES